MSSGLRVEKDNLVTVCFTSFFFVFSFYGIKSFHYFNKYICTFILCVTWDIILQTISQSVDRNHMHDAIYEIQKCKIT